MKKNLAEANATRAAKAAKTTAKLAKSGLAPKTSSKPKTNKSDAKAKIPGRS
jgi:hypothetical protein